MEGGGAARRRPRARAGPSGRAAIPGDVDLRRRNHGRSRCRSVPEDPFPVAASGHRLGRRAERGARGSAREPRGRSGRGGPGAVRGGAQPARSIGGVQMTVAKRLIPCLDVDAGRVVKGTNFVELRDAGDPAELAARYDREGADEVVFLDITATVEGRASTLEVIRETAGEVFIPLTVGGGVRSEDDVNALLRAGADKVSLNTAAVRDPSMLARCADRFGAPCIVIAIDAKRVNSHFEVFVAAGRTPTGRDAVEWAVEATARCGAGEIMLTSIDRDGTGIGYDVE